MATHSIALASSRRVPQGPVDALVNLAKELASVTTLEGLRYVLAGPLRPLLPSREIPRSCAWRTAPGKRPVGPEDGPDRIHQCSWTPLAADGKTVGMLGVGAPSQQAQSPGYAECATTMLAMSAQHLIAIENLQACARDGLTGCFTRTHAMELLEKEPAARLAHRAAGVGADD